MSSLHWLEKRAPRNTIVEKVDSTGRFKVITHYDQTSRKRTIVQRLDTRFRKGQSGNPKGRPKGSLNASTLLKDMFNTTVPVREGEKRQFMTRADAMIRGTMANALRGDARSLTTIMDLLEMTGYLDLPIDEGREWGPLIINSPADDLEEWALLGPHRENERKRYLAMAEEEEALERAQKQPLGNKEGKSP
jgi:hypothetical protein